MIAFMIGSLLLLTGVVIGIFLCLYFVAPNKNSLEVDLKKSLEEEDSCVTRYGD